MSKILPHPILAVVLFIFWLVLQQSAGLGHMLLGAVIAIGVSMLANAVIPEPLTVRRPLKVLQLVFVAGLDIIRSNMAVLWVLLHPRPRPTAGFVEMKLELTNPFALAVLATLITATPGSAWLEYDRDRSVVLIHVFDLVDADDWVETIKNRYESLLLEIFQ
ncbi:Na+/H+ antiporter subunit E [Devosia sp. 63-57]|uniref:Na+/H+ antiporter subunit E n=1 Tax=Devosia sp. 63-57 TaxID=1895751 RepID=UPI00086D48CA|nr:Na+/H+ antiporter subunit E [Devosia sp. 63-57]ODT47701.1 MAG: Na+/H+ antiporter subunit E [Pelagibacterium sp. SCN 63-126]ODU88243.1 MAG: Na+/H+ antiporter subunit E [Pelagibacterium sp. SCN 63-17]OJX42591.1 MAG: Na+/H+ antiporter subunit E [Devosia sp. 63-57]